MPANFPIQYQGTLRSATNPDASGGRGFNIADFRSHRDKVGILRTHDFHIQMPWPPALIRDQKELALLNNIELSCDSINFPGTGADISKVQRYSYGAFESRPTFPQFSDLQCTFMTDQAAILYKFFHDWMRLVVNYDFDGNVIVGNQMAAYEISYKDEYAVDMFLYIYNPYGKLVRQVGFRQAFPTQVQDVLFSWSRRDEMVKVPVAFSFMDWHEVPVPPNDNANMW